MATKYRKAAKPESLPKLPSGKIEVTFSGPTLERISKYMNARGLLKEQEVVRLSVGFFLQNQGF